MRRGSPHPDSSEDCEEGARRRRGRADGDRGEKVIRIFPNETSAWRLLGAYLAEIHEEWSTGRCYLRMDEYEAWKAERDGPEPVPRAAA